eukprot:3592702-Heterocapsa_arctica.AAC.1
MKAVSGDAIIIMTGHLVHFFMLSRSMLSTLSEVWAFAAKYGATAGVLPASVRAELRTAAGLLLV